MTASNSPAKPTIYCKRCLYALDGLQNNRCPECGAIFDPADPRTLYHTPKSGVWKRLAAAAWRARRGLFIVGLVLSALVFEETCCSWDRRGQVCPHCGAWRDVRAFSGPGLDWTYSAVVNEGPVSRFVQAIDGRPCPHQWESYHFAGGGLLYRSVANGGGRRVWLLVMEGSYPDLETLLHRRASMDPTFTARFLDLIRTDDHDRYEQFLDDFMAWAESQTSRPSDGSLEPTSAPG